MSEPIFNNNYKKFIDFNKKSCVEFNVLDWNATSWGNGIYFGKHRMLIRDNKKTIMCNEICNLAKAMIFFECYPNINKSYKYLLVFKLMEVSFTMLKLKPSVLNLDFLVIEKIIQIASENYNNDNVCKIEHTLRDIIVSLIEKQILPNTLRRWESNKRYGSYVKPNISSNNDLNSKLPDQQVLDLIGSVFSHDDLSDKDVFITSIVALLMSAPTRISEVMKLTVDCEVFEEDSKGNLQYGIRYIGGKGFGHTIKWIPESMQPITQIAISRLRELSKSARAFASIIELGEIEFYRTLRAQPNQLVDIIEVDKILNLEMSSNVCRSNEKIINLITKGKLTASNLWEQLSRYTPSPNPWEIDNDLKYRDRLFLIHKDQFHQAKSTNIFSYQLSTRTMFFADFKKGGNFKRNFFSRHKELCKSGMREVFKSHSIRHLLNTLAQESFLSDFEIALWSGRKDIRQNSAYDNRSSEEIRDNDRKILFPNENFFEMQKNNSLTELISHKNKLNEILSVQSNNEIRQALLCFSNDLEVFIDFLRGGQQ